MRKLILASALLLASVSAQAGDTRSLSLAGIPTATAATEAPKPIAQVSVQLAQAATTANDAAPVQIPAPPAPVQAQAPAPVQTTAPAATTTTAAPAAATPTATETKTATTTESKPKTARKVRRETDEGKARRIAARYGVYW